MWQCIHVCNCSEDLVEFIVETIGTCGDAKIKDCLIFWWFPFVSKIKLQNEMLGSKSLKHISAILITATKQVSFSQCSHPVLYPRKKT